MIESLTPQQQTLIPKIREEYLHCFFSLQFDEQKAVQLMNFIYHLIRNPNPTILILDSPLSVQFACNILQNKWDQVRTQVWDQVWDQVGMQKLEFYSFCDYGDCSDLNWVSFYDLFIRLRKGIVHLPLFTEYKSLIKAGVFMWVGFENIAILSRPPLKISRDPQNRLHNPTEAAVQFKDGYCQYWVHGVSFTEEEFKTWFPVHEIDAATILAVQDVDKRSAILDVYGYEYLLTHLPNVKLLDTDHDFSRVLDHDVEYQLSEFEYEHQTFHALKIICHSTGRPHVVLTPSNLMTVKASWLWLNPSLDNTNYPTEKAFELYQIQT